MLRDERRQDLRKQLIHLIRRDLRRGELKRDQPFREFRKRLMAERALIRAALPVLLRRLDAKPIGRKMFEGAGVEGFKPRCAAIKRRAVKRRGKLLPERFRRAPVEQRGLRLRKPGRIFRKGSERRIEGARLRIKAALVHAGTQARHEPRKARLRRNGRRGRNVRLRPYAREHLRDPVDQAAGDCSLRPHAERIGKVQKPARARDRTVNIRKLLVRAFPARRERGQAEGGKLRKLLIVDHAAIPHLSGEHALHRAEHEQRRNAARARAAEAAEQHLIRRRRDHAHLVSGKPLLQHGDVSLRGDRRVAQDGVHLGEQLHEHVVDLRAFLHQLETAFPAQALRLRRKLAAHIEPEEVIIQCLRFRARSGCTHKVRAQLHERPHQRRAGTLRSGRHLAPGKGSREQVPAHAVAQHIQFKFLRILRRNARKAGFGRLQHIPLPEGARRRKQGVHHKARRGIARKRMLRIREERDAPRPQRPAHGVDVSVKIRSDHGHVAVTDAAIRRRENRIRNGLRLRGTARAREQGDRLRRVIPGIRQERIGKAFVLQMPQRRVRTLAFILVRAGNGQADDPRRAALAPRDVPKAHEQPALRFKHGMIPAIRRKIHAQGDGERACAAHERGDHVIKLFGNEVKPVNDDGLPGNGRAREPFAQRGKRIRRIHVAAREIIFRARIKQRQVGKACLERRARGEPLRRALKLLRRDVETLALRKERVALLRKARAGRYAAIGGEPPRFLLRRFAHDHPAPLAGKEHGALPRFPQHAPRKRRKRKDRRLQQAARQGGRKLAFGLKGKLFRHDERDILAARTKLRHLPADQPAFSAARTPGEEGDRGGHQKRSRCSGL